MSHIIGYASTCDGASHISSVADIVLGSFRYCVNEEDKDIAGRELLPLVVRMMWHKRKGDEINVMEKGLTLRPREIRAPAYRAEYEALRQRLSGLLR